ncbi:MAG: tRNA (adenosine(37)-N6)-dimethylallyltransferase MiaA [Oscillospiraceae bacterium]|jgi:tRNA dimethylallyltransferase|nr:tRNA (adenosine(37)-N6)-dimethylallyltransferase MiaA [Oscillospiraceae bacterium]
MSKLLVITGPTATGKTELGVRAALALGGEVVSADSMQIYRGMDIGTAKPTTDETRRDGIAVPHHMLDVAEPTEPYSVSRYVAEATAVIDDITARGKLPIVVGGTGLYIDALIAGRDFAPAHDGELLRELEARYDALGGEALLRELSAFDPDSAARLHANDKSRVIRAIEIYRLTGETMTRHDARTREAPPRHEAAILALSYAERARLYERIDARVDAMMAAGLAREVQTLLDGGVPRGGTAMQAIGYKELADAINGETDTDAAVALIKRRSRNYAKRQLTWWRVKPNVTWQLWENTPNFDVALRVLTEIAPV